MKAKTFQQRYNSLKHFILLFFLYGSIVFGQTVQVTVPNTSGGSGTTVSIPIQVNDVSGKGVYSYGLKFTYNQSVIQSTGASSSGTISSSWGAPTYTIGSGLITVAAAGSSPLSGSGSLVFISFSVVGSAGSSSALHFSEMKFNEGTPGASKTDGTFTVSGSDVTADEFFPKQFKLFPAYPNPFNPSTTIEFDLPRNGHVIIKVFDMLGHFVSELKNETLEIGHYSLEWNGRDFNNMEVSSGVYFFQIFIEQIKYNQKIVKLK